MSKLAVIEEVLHDKFVAVDQSQLIEEDIDTKGKKFKVTYPIISGRVDYRLFRFDPNKEDIFPYFKPKSGLKKICDYILFAEEGQYLYVFIIELKLGPSSSAKQLQASKVFINYIIESARRVGFEIDENVAIRTIRIADNAIIKRKIKEEIISYNQDGHHDYRYKSFRLKLLMNF